MLSFTSKILIISINPYVLLPAKALKAIHDAAGKSRGPIPVKGTVNGHPFRQTLVKYSGKWRLYVNMPMLKGAGSKVGDRIEVSLEVDSSDRTVPLHPALKAALAKNKKAQSAFDKLSPSRQKEINRYLAHLKSEEAVKRNIERAIRFLLGKDRFAGRNK